MAISQTSRSPSMRALFAQPLDVVAVTPEVRIHTIELFVHTPPAGFRSTIERCLQRRISIKPCKGSSGYIHGYRAIINDPTCDVLKILQQLIDSNRDVFVHRIDVAIDYKYPDKATAQLWKRFLVRHVLMKWPPRGRSRGHIEQSDYWVRLEKGSRRPSRNMIAYPKDAGTLVRFEIRFLGSASVRRPGLDHLPDLVHLDPSRLIARYVKVVDIKRGTLINLLRQHAGKTARLLAMIDRMTIQDFVRGRRRPERLLRTHPISVLKVPQSITVWPASGNHH